MHNARSGPNLCHFVVFFAVLVASSLGASSQSKQRPAPVWRDMTSSLLRTLKPTAFPGGCSGVVVNRLNGEATIKVVGMGLYRSGSQGYTWQPVEGNPITGRDETGWATNVDANDPARLASFSLDGVAGMRTSDGTWQKFADVERNWDYGSVDWSVKAPRTIIAARHESSPQGQVYVSFNGGASWRRTDILLGDSRQTSAMVGALPDAAVMYSNGNGIYRSTDYGYSWKLVSHANPLTRIPVLFKSVYYLGTADGLLASHDQGQTWTPQGSRVHIRQGPFFGADEKNMVVVGDGGVYRSVDGGDHWVRLCGLKDNDQGYSFGASWFGCYAWDPVHNAIYASSMGHSIYKLDIRSGR